jgi:hypothetical protein
MNVEQPVEWELAMETEVLEEKIPCPPKIPHDVTWARTRAAAMASRRLTVWAMARPKQHNFLANPFNFTERDHSFLSFDGEFSPCSIPEPLSNCDPSN